MVDKQNRTIKLGLFIFLAVVLFILAVFIIGRKQDMFRPTIKITTEFRNVKGLTVGKKVRFTGIEVGTVLNLTILSDTVVSVELSLDKDVIPYIKKDSRATIGNEGLMGSKIIIILPGSPGSFSVEEGDKLPVLESVELDDIMNEIKQSSKKISKVADNLIEITDKINNGDGVFGKIFTDTTFTKNIGRTSNNIAALTSNLKNLTGMINNGEGLIGKMFTDTLLSNRVDTASRNLALISSNLVEITDKINKGEGIFERLFTDTIISAEIFSASKNLNQLSGQLLEVSQKLNSENNALHKFIADSIFADSINVLLHRINEGVVEVTAAAEALQRSGVVRMFSKDGEEKKVKEKDIKPDSSVQ